MRATDAFALRSPYSSASSRPACRCWSSACCAASRSALPIRGEGTAGSSTVRIIAHGSGPGQREGARIAVGATRPSEEHRECAGPAVDALTARFVAALGRRGAMAEVMAVASLGGPPHLVDDPAGPPRARPPRRRPRPGRGRGRPPARAARGAPRVACGLDPDGLLRLGRRRSSRATPTRRCAGRTTTSGPRARPARTGGALPRPPPPGRGVLPPARRDPLGPRRGWVDEPAGELVHHAPWQPHAMLTGDRPVLLAYLWFGEVDTPSSFVDG